MAANGNEDIDLTENAADMLLFAENLVDYMLLRNSRKFCSDWKLITFRNNIFNAFAPIREELDFLDDTMENEHYEFYCKLEEGNFRNLESYEIFAKTLAEEYFSEAFDAKYFLIYCVNLSIMAEYFYDRGIIGVPDLARVQIYKCLQEYNILVCGWDAIHRFAGNYEELLLDSGNKLTSSDTSLDSDEIRHKDLQQEEVDADTNSLQIEEQSVLSGNEEIKLKQINVFLLSLCGSKIDHNKYIQYSSKSRSEIGLCSLKEHASFSEDASPRVTLEENKAINRSKSDHMPTADTSNVDQELILITSAFKKKMDLLWNKVKCGDKHVLKK